MSQNLVKNPSFENTINSCNTQQERFSTDLLNWNNGDTNPLNDSCSTPDLFSICNDSILGIVPNPLNMPNSALGYQYARSGVKMAGIITYNQAPNSNCVQLIGLDWREYIQGELITPLVAEQKYKVSFYVSLANKAEWASNNIGVYFSNNGYYRDACALGSLINITPHLNYNSTPILDTANWVYLEWEYIASGGENFIMIGNFLNSLNTQITCNNTAFSHQFPYAYYFIDDVSVVPTEPYLCSNSLSFLNDTLSGNGVISYSLSGHPPFQYLWDWGDGNTDTIEFPNHSYNSEGTYTICLTATDFIECTSFSCFENILITENENSVVVQNNPITSTNANSIGNLEINVFPNPAKGTITIKCEQGSFVYLVNDLGVIIKTYKPGNTMKIEINLEENTPGLYSLVLKNKNKTFIKKILLAD